MQTSKTNPSSQEIGRNIRILRHKIGWTQTDVARKLKISTPAYSKIETGKTDMNISRLNELAEIFNVDIYTMIGPNRNSLTNDLNAQVLSLNQELLQTRRDLNNLQEKTIGLYEELAELKNQKA